MKCIIVDDEPLAREGMELNVKDVALLSLEGSFEDAVSALNYIQHHEVDLMFCDIQMPGGMTGLDLLRALGDRRPMVIMTTAYSEHALEGFELGVVDYLVKPIRMDRFVQAVNKAHELHSLRQKEHGTADSGQIEEAIFIKADRKYVRLEPKDIKYIKGMKDYVMIYTGDQRYMTAMNIKTIFNQLDHPCFVRVSKSYIINVDHIQEINNHSVLIDGEEIPLGKTYKEEFIKQIVADRLLQR